MTNSPALPFIWTGRRDQFAGRFYRVKLGPPLP